jgi:uncharacterized protein
MRKLCILLVVLSIPFFAYSGDLPKPSGWVNDFAQVIGPQYAQKLNALIGELEQKTSSEIAVVTIDSIAPYDEKAYARMLFDNWKPGKKGKDNGVLILLAVKERRWRIETGYGVEGILPDGVCGDIGRNYLVPYFKQGQYAQGLYVGTLKIAEIIAKDANINLSSLEGAGDLVEQSENVNGSSLDQIVVIIIFLLIFGFSILPVFLGRRYGGIFWGGTGGFSGGGFGGGGFGGGGGGGGGAGGGF